jgi:tetratricopeptide (TPR) repeat protein
VNERSKLLPFAAALRRPDPARMAEFAETARRIQHERTASDDIVSTALRDTPRETWASLRDRHELHTSGALERLGQEIDKRLDTDPREALAIAELAASVADALAPDSYPAIMLAQLRAHAWRDRGQALSYLGHYDDALRALDRAEEQFQKFGTLGHDRAMVRFCRATLLQHLRRFDEARTILDECRQVFQSYSDMQSYVKCTLATGNLLVRKGDYRGAREMLEGLLGSGDSLREATVRCTLGWCAIHLGQLDDALSHFDEVARCISDSPVDVARAAYGTGSALLRLGDLDAAIRHLRSARRTFLAHNLVEEAGLNGLEIVEALLLQGGLQEAQSLASQIVGEFTAARLNRRAVTALAYLHDAVATTNATAETARNVYDYIAALRADPTREFVTIN